VNDRPPVDKAPVERQHVQQCALGRLLSAARETTSTQSVRERVTEPSSGLVQRTTGISEGRIMPRPITPRTSLDNLKREAKRWLNALQAGSAEAQARLRRSLPALSGVATLRDVQHALALEHGLHGWTALKRALAQDATLRQYERVAEALVTAYRTPDEIAMRIVWEYFGHMRAWDAMRRYVRLDLGKAEQPTDPADDHITIEEAQYLVARGQGFEHWAALAAFAASVAPDQPHIAAKAIAVYPPAGWAPRMRIASRHARAIGTRSSPPCGTCGCRDSTPADK
jgi:hypothetical protein